MSASAAAWAEREGWQCVVITSDRDTFAHLSATTRVLRLIDGGIHGSPLLDPARLFTMYGVAAEHYLDYAALRGDASDNLPGVAGIGEKSAALLLAGMGSMQEVWADIEHAERRQPGRHPRLVRRGVGRTAYRRGGAAQAAPPTGAREQFEFNRALMTGRDDVDLGLSTGDDSPGRLPLDPDAVAQRRGLPGGRRDHRAGPAGARPLAADPRS